MSQEEFVLSYKFSCQELKALGAAFREKQDKIPRELFNFAKAVQGKLYECMTIDEVEKLQK